MVQQKIEFGKCFLIVGILLTLIIISSVDCKEIDGRGDFAEDRIVYVSNGGYKQDGQLKTDSRTYSWIVLDLKTVIELKNIDILTYRDGANTFSVYMSSEFYPCEQKSPELRATWKLCRHFKNIDFAKEDDFFTEPCVKPVVGQFLIITYGSPYAWNITAKHLSFENIRAYGKELTNERVQNLKLEEIIKPITTKMSELMPIRHAIFGGLSSIKVPKRVNEILFVNENSEALLWSSNKKVFMVATEVGKGRVITIGSEELLTIFEKNSFEVLKKMRTWLRWNDNNQIRNIVEHYKKGDLVIARSYDEPNQKQVENAISMLLSGDISMIVIVHPNNIPLKENSYLLKISNVTGVYSTRWNHDLENIINLPTDARPDFCALSIAKIFRLSLETPILLGECNEYSSRVLGMLTQTLDDYESLKLNLDLKKTSKLLMGFLRKYKNYIHFNAPCPTRKMLKENERKFYFGMNNFLASPFLYDSGYKAPGVGEFPGDFESAPAHPREPVTLTFTSFQLDAPETHHTGLYLPAGDTLTLEVKRRTALLDKWSIRIGCHTDILQESGEWQRFPVLSSHRSLKHLKIYSAFGGVVMIESHSHNQNITITFHNAVRTALYNSRENNAEKNFDNRKHLPAPWTELVGDSVVLCVPMEDVRMMKLRGKDIVDIVKDSHDKSVKMAWHSVGFKWNERRRLRVSADIQSRSGVAHSGYPIVVPMSEWSNLRFNIRNNEIDVWGVLHEYNHMTNQWPWIFDNFGQTTTNLLTMLTFETVLDFNFEKNNYFKIYSRIPTITTYLNEQSYESMPDVSSMIFFYHISKCYGWGLYQKVFKKYVTDNINPKDDQDKRDQMVILMSRISGYNVKPFFDYWKVPLSGYVQSVTNKYPCVFPDDLFTKINTNRVNNILGQYKSCSRSCPPMMNATFPDFDIKLLNTVVEEE